MARVLFLGCNANQVPYLEAARALGFEVIGTDRNAAAPGATRADHFEAVGYDDVAGLRRIAEHHGLGPDDRIFTASAHLAYEAASVVAAERGVPFPSPEAIATALDKTRFYPRCAAVGLRVPPTRELLPDATPHLDPERVYWLKSDYGKSPRWCFRVTDGRLPERPPHDAFYRRAFVLQDEIEGRHWRLNLWGDELAAFARNDQGGWCAMAGLGAAQEAVAAGLRGFLTDVGLEGGLTKWDLIEREGEWFVLDLGLDPPARLRTLCAHRGVDFPAAYTRLHLLGDTMALPPWSELRRPLEIAGDGERGWTVAPVATP